MSVIAVFRSTLAASLIAGAALVASAGSASAFGDRCFGPVRATGQTAGSMQAARASARTAWESSVARRQGSKYAEWTYSGDRTFECRWNSDGSRISCVAEALPCGRK
jgi:type IV secretory pathway TrbL component